MWTRRIAAGGVGALLLAVLLGTATLAWLHARFDANRYQGIAIDWVRAHYQRTLTIDGPVELSFFPRLAVQVGKLALTEPGEPGKARDFAALEHASLGIDVLPLLRGKVVIGSVKARGVRVNYRRDAQGRSNIEDFLDADKLPAHTSIGATDGGARALHVDVSRIELADVRARVQDELTGVIGDVTLATLTTGRLAERTEAPLSFAARFALTSPAAKGELNGDATLLMDLAARRFALRHLNLALKADTRAVSAIDATLHGTLAWSGAQRALDATTLELRLSANANSVKLVGSSIAIERFGLDPAAKSWSVQQLRARLRGTQGGQPMSLDLDWPRLAVAAQQLSGSALTGSLKLDGPTPLDVRFKTAAPDGGIDALRLPGFDARIVSNGSTAGGPARKLSGQLRADLLLRPALPALAFDALELKATLEEDKLAPIAIGLRGQALASTQQSTWSLSGELNADRFDVQGLLTLTGPTPTLKATARFDALDLNRFLPRGRDAGGARPESDSRSDAPVDLSPLRAMDADVTLRAGRIAWQHYRVADLRLAAQLQGGMLRLGELKGRAWNGEFDATAFADARASRVALKGSASGIDVQALLHDATGRDSLQGKGRLVLDLDTAGRSHAEMKSRLAGSASVQVRDGAVKGVNLAKLLRQTRAAVTLKPTPADGAHRAVPTEATDFGEFNASWRIAEGVALSEDIELKSPFLRMSGDGTLNIATSELSFIAKTTLAATAQGQGGTATVKGLVVPVRLTGTLDAPLWTIVWSQTAGELLTPEVRDRIKERWKGLMK